MSNDSNSFKRLPAVLDSIAAGNMHSDKALKQALLLMTLLTTKLERAREPEQRSIESLNRRLNGHTDPQTSWGIQDAANFLRAKRIDALKVIFSLSEMEASGNPTHGFWSDGSGWADIEGARFYLPDESLELPASIGNDARSVELESALITIKLRFLAALADQDEQPPETFKHLRPQG